MDIFNNRDFTPMLLSEQKVPFDSDDFLYEIKFDGIRALCFINGDNILLQSRGKNNITPLFPEINVLKKLTNKKVVFDGEIVIFDDGVSSFSLIQKRLHLKNKNKIEELSNIFPITFVVFDILYENKDLTNLSLIQRKEILDKYNDKDVFVKCKYFKKNGISLFNFVKNNRLEGMVAKKINSKYYINKRSNDWIKIKNLHQEYFNIYGYIENKDTISLLLGEIKNNMVFYVGKVSVSKNNECYTLIKNSSISHNPFVNFDDKYAIYIKNKYKCLTEFLERSDDAYLRHPIFKKLE